MRGRQVRFTGHVTPSRNRQVRIGVPERRRPLSGATLATETVPTMADEREGCAACRSEEIRALWFTLVLNSVFTAAQVAGSIVSHSLALMGDTGTMVTDSITYSINIFAEYVHIRGADPRTSAAIHTAAAAISVIALVAVSVLTVCESIGRIMEITGDSHGSGGDEPKEVNAQVMFAFTLGNLFIDIGMLGSILLRKRGGWLGLLTCKCLSPVEPKRSSAAGTMDAQLLEEAVADPGDAPPSDAAGEQPARSGADLNVCSALAHVLADTLRTVTEMACSLLIWLDKDINGEMADAVSALLVCAIILAVACAITWETVMLVRQSVLKPTQRTPPDVVQPLPAGQPRAE